MWTLLSITTHPPQNTGVMLSAHLEIVFFTFFFFRRARAAKASGMPNASSAHAVAGCGAQKAFPYLAGTMVRTPTPALIKDQLFSYCGVGILTKYQS